jgi:hypothetical protein
MMYACAHMVGLPCEDSSIRVVTELVEMALRIGHYILGETLGAGTFGKVKSKFCP